VAYLAGGSTFNGEDRERYLGERTRGIVADVADLEWHSLGITLTQPCVSRLRMPGHLLHPFRPVSKRR